MAKFLSNLTAPNLLSMIAAVGASPPASPATNDLWLVTDQGASTPATLTAGGIAYATGSVLAVSAAGTTGQVLTSAGNAAPTWTNGPGANMGVPTSTVATGTAGVVGTETRDAVLGNYTFTALAGHRYEARVNGLGVGGTAASTGYFRIRNGGVTTPTATSTLIASTSFYIPASGGPGQITLVLGGTFVPGAGVQTLSVFVMSVTTAATPIFQRELFVVDLGLA